MKGEKAFTLVEMLVVIGIFSLVLEAIVGIFISAVSIQRKILSQNEVLDQISYALEYMGKAIRMAKKDDIEIYGQTINCLSGEKTNYEISSNSIKFRNYKNECQRFFLAEDKISEERITPTTITTTILPLTSPKLKVNSLQFRVNGQTQDDILQPSVTILLEIEGRGKNIPKMRIQTTISQRDADVQY